MKKSDLPSANQAKHIAQSWADGRPIRVMKQHRDTAEDAWNDATIRALIRRGWIAPSGSLPYSENGFLWEPHSVTPDGLCALECFLRQLRFDASEIGALRKSG